MPSSLTKIESTTDLVKRVHANLLCAISDGTLISDRTLGSGVRVMEEEIAEQLAVPRKPVLQALRLLRNDRFVLNPSDRGVLVVLRDVAAMVQFYQVRSALDTLAGRVAAQAHTK